MGLFPAFDTIEGETGPPTDGVGELIAIPVSIRGRRLVLLVFKGVPANGRSSSRSLSFYEEIPKLENAKSALELQSQT